MNDYFRCSKTETEPVPEGTYGIQKWTQTMNYGTSQCDVRHNYRILPLEESRRIKYEQYTQKTSFEAVRNSLRMVILSFVLHWKLLTATSQSSRRNWEGITTFVVFKTLQRIRFICRILLFCHLMEKSRTWYVHDP